MGRHRDFWTVIQGRGYTLQLVVALFIEKGARRVARIMH